MKQPLVSVIIPTYKRNDSLKRAIDSVLKQTYENYEIIVVDDNDEDSVFRLSNEKLMKEYSNNKKVVYLKHKKNLNGAAARNTGISYSRAKYIAFLDDDDEFMEKKLELQVKKLEKLDKSWGAVYCNYSIFRKNRLIFKNRKNVSGNLMKDLLLKDVKIYAGSTLLVRKRVLDELNGFDTTFNRHQDWEFLIRFFRKYKIGVVNQNLVKIHKDDTSNFPNSELLIRTKKKFFLKFNDDIKKMETYIQKEIYKRHLLDIVRALIRERNLLNAVKVFKKAKRYSRISLLELLTLFFTFVDTIFHFKYMIIYFINNNNLIKRKLEI